jgi:threonine aldolase
MIDLRSDTVTRPSPAMRQAMATAEVGDDVFGDDPTVNKLQERVAQLFGKEAALYVPSGTMGNQACLYAHTEPGDEILFEAGAHIFNYESAAPAALSGLLTHPIVGKRGMFTAEDVRVRVRPINVHSPRTRLVSIENTHNRAGGAIFPLDEIKRIHDVAREHGLIMHLDGARIWNAHVATGTPLAEYATYFDSISACFSKGLGCPVGSIIIGSREFVTKAHRVRKRFGGGLRQVGILAAAALYALDHNIERLKDDHANARWLSTQLAQIPGIDIDLEATQTNIIVLDVAKTGRTPQDIVDALKKRNVLAVVFGPTRIRCVTHLDVTRSDCEQAVAAFRDTLALQPV